MEFMEIYHSLCRGVVAGGNRNFGASFAGAGKVLQRRFGIPVLYRFELAGTEEDVRICRRDIPEWLSYTQQKIASRAVP